MHKLCFAVAIGGWLLALVLGAIIPTPSNAQMTYQGIKGHYFLTENIEPNQSIRVCIENIYAYKKRHRTRSCYFFYPEDEFLPHNNHNTHYYKETHIEAKKQ